MEKKIEATAQAVLMKRPALEALVHAFADFLIQKVRLVETLRREAVNADTNISVEHVVKGVPIFASTSLGPLKPALNRVLEELLPILGKTFPAMETEFAHLAATHTREPLDVTRLARHRLEGDLAAFETQARDLGVAVPVLEFVIGLTVATVLESLQPVLAQKIRTIPWQEGCCPICGSLPSLSFLAASDDLPSEFLKGGGGQKYLHCSHCSHEWRIKRNRCPACGNEDSDLLIYYQVPEEPAERVDICRKCSLYLPCVDLREIDARPHLDMTAIGMVHLDAYAQREGFKPMAWTAWNRLE